jgi:serine/threonine-protein kinase
MSTVDRLRLFVDVCHAIQHAHQKGIIHRDLKPSNVLVTLHDSHPVPKVIDFGIAKATSHRLTEKTLFTEFRQFIGTPEYMSPDQAEISGLDVDTRTDIYSLGVLLYELITGTTPLDPETLRGAGYAAMQKMILEDEPPKPSTRLGSSTSENLTDLARDRRVEASALSRSVRGDLDWIIMKAMEKDRTRRYQAASELADDIERHLGNLPVLAGPPSTLYRMRKFIRRHRVGVTVSALAAALVIVALPVSVFG